VGNILDGMRMDRRVQKALTRMEIRWIGTAWYENGKRNGNKFKRWGIDFRKMLG
jgi:predicted nucleic acid-binding Zn ribbon protein